MYSPDISICCTCLTVYNSFSSGFPRLSLVLSQYEQDWSGGNPCINMINDQRPLSCDVLCIFHQFIRLLYIVMFDFDGFRGHSQYVLYSLHVVRGTSKPNLTFIAFDCMFYQIILFAKHHYFCF